MKDCSVEGEEVCSVEHESECWTRNIRKEVRDAANDDADT